MTEQEKEADRRITCDVVPCMQCGQPNAHRFMLDGKRLATGPCFKCQDDGAKRAVRKLLAEAKAAYAKANPRLRLDSRIGLDIQGNIIPTLVHRGRHDNC